MKNLFYLLFIISFFSCSNHQPETQNTQPELSLEQSSKTKKDPNEYYENGNIRVEKITKGNEEHWIFKQEDGGCWEEIFYRDGDIYRKIVYNSDCTKSAEYELKDGKRNGDWVSYNENGTFRETGKYLEGLPDGKMSYYDTANKIICIDYHLRKDSVPKNIFQSLGDLNSIKATLTNNKINFTEKEEIKVAGSDLYYFPILKWGKSELRFDRKVENNLVKCVSGKITFKEMDLLMNFKLDINIVDLMIKIGKSDYPYQTANIYLYALKYQRTFRFELENNKTKYFYFEGLDIAY